MEKCNGFRDLMADALSGEILPDDRRRLQEHLRNCASCRQEFSELESVLMQVKDMPRPEPDQEFWGRYMDRLEGRLDEMERGDNPASRAQWLRMRSWRRLIVPLTAAALLVIGVLVGRMSLRSPVGLKDRQSRETLAVADSKAGSGQPVILQAHLGRMEPLLLDLSNREAEAGSQVVVGERVLRDLLMQNYLLKRLVDRQSDEAQKKLLDDLELILLEMQNPDSSGAREIVQGSDVLFELRLMRQKVDSL